MGNLQGWEALCQRRTAAQWEEDSARTAISAAIVARLEPTPAAIARWRRACERSLEVNALMRGYVHAASLSYPAAIGELGPGAARTPLQEMDGARCGDEKPLRSWPSANFPG